MTESRAALHADLLRFIAQGGPGDAFDALAVRVLAYQIDNLPAYARLCAGMGYAAGDPWRDAPLVPTELFRESDLCSLPAAPEQRVFRTSGTTGAGSRGFRRAPDLSLYDAAMTAPFVARVLDGDASPRPWLCLIPHDDMLPNSSLSHMTTALSERLAADVTWAMTADGLDTKALAGAFDGDAPVLVMTTAFALVHWLDGLPLGRPLPPGSRMMVTGGFKGKSRDVDEAALLADIATRLGIDADAVVPEYGMTELASQAYGRPFAANPALRLRVVDPATHEALPMGETGLVACFDLLNLDNVSAIVTSDLGRLDETKGQARLTLIGRAPEAVQRGCSLTAEAILERMDAS